MNKGKKHSEPATTAPPADKLQGGFRSLSWMAAVTLILAVAVAAGFYWERTVTVTEVRFEGNRFVEDSTLAAAVEVPLGVRPDSLDYMAIIGQAEGISWVRKADVEVEPSGKLLIRLTERRPLALLAGGGKKMYVDAEGVALPFTPGKAVDLPLLYGFRAEAGDTLGGGDFAMARDFLQVLRGRPVSDATISELAWTSDRGLVALTHENGVKLLFGRENYLRKLQNWEAFYSEIIRRKGMHSMRELDLRFRGQIVSR